MGWGEGDCQDEDNGMRGAVETPPPPPPSVTAADKAAIDAVRAGNLEALTCSLLAGGDPNASTLPTGRALLHIATQQGSEEVVKHLIGSGADANARSLRQVTPLHLACKKDKYSIARILLEASADPNMKDERGETALHHASQEGRTEIARLLLQCDADVTSVDVDGWTPLHSASWAGAVGVVRLLLKANALTEVKDAAAEATPLHLAATMGHVQVIHLLLESGADTDALDSHDLMPEQVVGQDEKADMTDDDVDVIVSILHERREQRRGGEDYAALQHNNMALVKEVKSLKASLAQAKADVCEARVLARALSTSVKDGGLASSSSPSSLEAATAPSTPPGARVFGFGVVERLLGRASKASCREEEGEDRGTGEGEGGGDSSAQVGADGDEDSSRGDGDDAHEATKSVVLLAVKPECMCCRTAFKSVVLEPCGHLATCGSCADDVSSCPVCEEPVSGNHLLSGQPRGEADLLQQMETLANHLEECQRELSQLKASKQELESRNNNQRLSLDKHRAEYLQLQTLLYDAKMRTTALNAHTPPQEGS